MVQVLLSPNSLPIQCKLLILRGIDINSPRYWRKQFWDVYKKILFLESSTRLYSAAKGLQNKLTIWLIWLSRLAQSQMLHY